MGSNFEGVAPVIDGARAGCLVATVDDAAEVSERALELLAGIAHQAKLAIANAGNFENLESTFLSTVEALANALEANDEYTSSYAAGSRTRRCASAKRSASTPPR